MDILLSELNGKLDVEATYKKYNKELSELYTTRYNFNPMHDKKFIAKAQSMPMLKRRP